MSYSMGDIVITCEKPDIANKTAQGLGKPIRKDGYIEVIDSVTKIPYIVTWAFGHMLEIDKKILGSEKWSLDNLPIFPSKFLYTPIGEKKKQLNIVTRLLKNAKIVINNGDAGREGELIQREIYEYANFKGKVKRVWTSAAPTPEVLANEIRNRLKDASEFDGEYKAGLARQHGDFLFGINMTQAVSVKAGGGGVWSIGRVQTPVLALLYERYLHRKNFVPKEYWTIKSIFTDNEKKYKFSAKFVKPKDLSTLQEEKLEGHISDDEITEINKDEIRLNKTIAEKIVESVKKASSGTITSIKQERKQIEPPSLFSIADAQKEAGKRFKFTGDVTLKLLQSLYEKHGCLSYPRTDYRHIREDDRDTVIQYMKNIGREDLIENVKKVGKRIFDNSKVGDHHALIPVAKLPPDVTENERKIYMMIYEQFCAAFSTPFIYDQTTINIEIGGYQFVAVGKRVVDFGFKKEFNDLKEADALPPLNKGDTVLIDTIEPLQQFTTPLPLWSDGKMIDYMAKKNLGTGATRANIITTLKERKYIYNPKGDSLDILPKGIALMEKIKGKRFTSLELTAEFEKKLEDIKSDKMSYNKFIDELKEFITEEIENVKNMELDGKSSALKTVTPKMKALAKKLSKQKGVKIDLDNYEIVSKFISENIKPKNKENEIGEYHISEKQRAIMEKNNILPEFLVKESLTREEYEKLTKAIGDFFKTSQGWSNNKKLSFSEKQIAIIEKNGPSEIVAISKKSNLTPNEYKKVKEWLDSYFAKLKK